MGPVSGTGRAMMASLNNAVQKGMPVDQAIAYVKSMAKDGVAPLVDLYAMLNQYQRLQQQQVRPPQTPPTIRDQVMASAQQTPMQAPMQQGLGGLDTGVMENAQFAGGGIVAFEGGGDVQSFQAGGATWEMNLIRQLRAQGLSLDEISRVVAEERAKRDVALGRTPEDRLPYGTERGQAVQADKPRELDLEQMRRMRERERLAEEAQIEARAVEREARTSGAKPAAPASVKAPPSMMRRGLSALGRYTGLAGLGLGAANLMSNVGEEAESRQGEGAGDEPVIPIGPFGVAYSTRTAPKPSDVGSMYASLLGFGGREEPVEEATTVEDITTPPPAPAPAPAPAARPASKLPASKAMSYIDSAISNLQKEGPDALTAEQSAEVAKRLADLPAQRRRDTYLALSQAGFSMAEAASKPGAKFLGALGAGGKEASRLLTMLNKDLRDVENDLRKEMFAIEREGARITRDRENKIMDLNVIKQRMQEDRNTLEAQLGVRREEIGSRERLTTATTEATAAQREFSNRLQVDRLVQEQTGFLELQKQQEKDPEKRAEIQKQIDAIRNSMYAQYGIAPVAAVNPRTASPDQFGELKQVNTGG